MGSVCVAKLRSLRWISSSCFPCAAMRCLDSSSDSSNSSASLQAPTWSSKGLMLSSDFGKPSIRYGAGSRAIAVVSSCVVVAAGTILPCLIISDSLCPSSVSDSTALRSSTVAERYEPPTSAASLLQISSLPHASFPSTYTTPPFGAGGAAAAPEAPAPPAEDFLVLAGGVGPGLAGADSFWAAAAGAFDAPQPMRASSLRAAEELTDGRQVLVVKTADR